MNYVSLDRLAAYIRQYAQVPPPDGHGHTIYSQGWVRSSCATRARIIDWIINTLRKQHAQKSDFMATLEWNDGPATTNRFPYAAKDSTGNIFFVNEGESAPSLFPVVAHAFLWTDKEHRNGQS